MSTETPTSSSFDSQKLPQHIGIIMDGNGRWATGQRLPRIAGHRKGVERVQEITELSGKLGVSALTLFAFSDENWRRPEEEVSGLMGLLRWYLRAEKKRLLANNVRFRMLGDRLKLSSDIVRQVEELESQSQSNTGLQLSVGVSYGGRGELVRACKRICAQVERGDVFAQDVSEALIEQNLDTAGLPAVDLLIRTSGEMRISNFLLWQIAYAEMYFETCNWPDFTSQKFLQILKDYTSRSRRFGLTPDQTNTSTLAPHFTAHSSSRA